MKDFLHHANIKRRIQQTIIGVSVFVLSFIGGFGVFDMVFAAAPTSGIGFQGQLYNGSVAASGSINATFSFYDAVSGGSLQGSTIPKTISVSNGYFSTSFSPADLASIDFNQSLWIEVTVEGNTLTPRSAVNSVPFANKAFGTFSYSSAPSVGSAGSLYYNSVSGVLSVSNGTSWNAVAGGSSATTTINGVMGSAFSFATSSTGTDFSISTSTGTVTFNLPTASALNRGLLTSADYLRIPSTASSTEWVAASASTTALTPAYMRQLFSNTATGLTYNSSTGATSMTAGYGIPLTASTTEWAGFYAIPSTRITAGTGLSWSGNTLNSSFSPAFTIGNGLIYNATSTNLVGIGTSSPSTTLFVQGKGGTNPFAVASSSGTQMLTLTQEGNLGIGTSTPTSKLALVGGNFTHTASGNPTLVGTYNTTGVSYKVHVSGKYAYVADNTSGLQIIDVSNPASSTLVGTYNTSGNAYGVYVSGKYAYVADALSGLHVIDVSNPTSPTLVGTYNTSDNANGVYVSGKYAYVADGTSGLLIIDVSSPASPTLVGTYNTSGNAYAVYVSGKYAYVADYTSGLHIIDISNPTSPVLSGTYNTSGNAYGVYVSGKYAYVADDSSGLQIINISNPATPTLVGTYDTSGNANEVYVSGKYAYVADGGSGLQVIDVSIPATPTLVGTYDTSAAQFVYVSGKYAYVADDIAGLQILDINGIETPSLYAGNIETNVLNATENIIAGGDIYAQGGLNVGISGIFSRGGLGVFVASTTTANPISATFMGGNVGVGTSSPGARLDVWGNLQVGTSTIPLIFANAATGRVGIGTSSPLYNLHVRQDQNAGTVIAVQNNTSGSGAFAQSMYNTPSDSFQVGISSAAYTPSGGAELFGQNTAWMIGSPSYGVNLVASHAAGVIRFGTGGVATVNERMRISSAGLVGIGSTTPSAQLTASSSGTTVTAIFDQRGTGDIFQALDAGTAVFVVKDGGNVGMGTSSPGARLDVWGNLQVGTSSTPLVFANTATGRVGISQASPATILHVGSTAVADATNLLRLQDADSTCDFNANAGSPSCGSDATLKKNIISMHGNLDKVLALRPVSYMWNTDTDDSEVKIGFIAQEVGVIMPELVRDGTWIDGTTRKFLSTGGMMPYLVGAVQEQHLLIGDSASSTAPLSAITLLVDAAQSEVPRTAYSHVMDKINSGMRPLLDFMAVRITAVRGYFDEMFAKKVHTDQLCIGNTCLTEDQLKALMMNAPQSSFNNTGGGVGVDNPALPVSDPVPVQEPSPVPPTSEQDVDNTVVVPAEVVPETTQPAQPDSVPESVAPAPSGE